MRVITILFVFVFGHTTTVVSAQLPESTAAIFKYHREIIPKYAIDSTFHYKEVVGERIVFTGTAAFQISAYIIRPNENWQNRPFVLFNHAEETNKNEFLSEALFLAHNGFVCILTDAPWLCPGSTLKSFQNQAYEIYFQNVMNARTAIDLAQQHLKVNSDKIFCVGRGFGCNTSAVLAAIDSRIGYFVFMGGMYSKTENISQSQSPNLIAWKKNKPEQFKQWIAKMKPLDAENFLPYKAAPCLIQIANKDEYISDEENDAFVRLTAVPKEVKIYDVGHAFNKKAERDRFDWIVKNTN